MSMWSPALSAVISATTIAASPEGTSTVPAAPERSVQAEHKALGRGRAARAIGEALRPVLEGRDVGIEYGRAAKRRHVDEALRELGVAAEIHQARAAL